MGGHQAVARASVSRPSGAQRGEIGVGVVGAAGQRRRGDQQEALGAGDRGVFGEFLGRDEAVDRGVFHRRLQVLADGQEIDVGDAQVVHHLHDLGLVSPRPTIRPDLVNTTGSICLTRSSRRSDW